MNRLGMLGLAVFFGVALAAPGWSADRTMDKPYGAEKRTEDLGSTEHIAMGDIHRASELLDRRIENTQGDKLGSVKDLVIGRDGKVSYLILSRGGVLGMGDKLIPIPLQAATLSEDRIILNVTEDRLANAPSFSEDEWPNFNDPAWSQKVFGYYGVESNAPTMAPTQTPKRAPAPDKVKTPYGLEYDSGPDSR